jgi:hypothetical protein
MSGCARLLRLRCPSPDVAVVAASGDYGKARAAVVCLMTSEYSEAPDFRVTIGRLGLIQATCANEQDAALTVR